MFRSELYLSNRELLQSKKSLEFCYKSYIDHFAKAFVEFSKRIYIKLGFMHKQGEMCGIIF